MADPNWMESPIVEPKQPRGGPWEKYKRQSEQAGKENWRDAPRITFDDLIPGDQNTPHAHSGMFDDLVTSGVRKDDDSLLAAIFEGAETGLNALGYWSEAGAKMGADVLGAPVDLINVSPTLLNLLPGEQGMKPFSDNPVGGSEHLWSLLSKPRDAAQHVMGVPVGDDTPENVVERVGGRIAGELVAASIPGAALLSKAQTIGTAGARAMQTSPVRGERMLGSLLESAKVNPGRFARKEALYAAGAGTGAGLAREIVSDGDPNTTTTPEAIADLAGSFAGVGATASADALRRTAQDIATSVSGQGGSTVVRDAATGELARASRALIAPSGAPDTEGLANALQSSSTAPQRIPGYQDTTADVLQNPGVASLEYSRQSGSGAGKYAQRRGDNTRAVNDAIEAQAPSSTPGTFRERLSAKRDDALLEAETKQYLAQTEFEKAADNLAAVQSGEARGQTVRAALDDALAKAKEAERAAWAGIDGNIDPAGLDNAFDEITNGLTLAERQVVAGEDSILSIPRQLVGDEDAALVAQITGEGVRLSEVTTLRSTLTDKVRTARSAGDHNKARVLDQYVGAIDGFLDQAAPDVVEQMETARAVTRDLNDRFTRPTTPIAQTLDRNQGQPRVPDSEVTGKFVRPDEGQASNIDALLKETGNAADVRAALEDQIRAGAQKYLDKPDQLEAYLDQHKAVFGKFPELRDEFGTAAALKRTANDAAVANRQTQRDLGTDTKPGRNTVGRYLKFGDERAVDAMAGVVNAPDPAKAADELLQFAGREPQAIEGAKSAFWKLMERDAKSSGFTTRVPGGEQAWRPQSLYNFLQDPKKRAVMERLYSDDPEQMGRIDEIATVLRDVDLRVTAKAPNSSGTPQAIRGNDVLPSTETIGAYSFAYQRGQVGLPFIGLRLISTMARRATLKGRSAEFEELLDKALLEPEVAEMLLREHNPANVAAMNRSAKLWLGNRAPAIAELLSDDESEPSEDDSLLDHIFAD